MKRNILPLLLVPAILSMGFLKWGENRKIVLLKVEGPLSKSQLGYNCIYDEGEGGKRVYSYAWGSYSIQCYSIPEGKSLFQIKRTGGKGGYFLGHNFSVIGDINGDGFSEIATPESWSKKELLIFSGKEGRLFKRIKSPDLPYWSDSMKILPADDFDGDGRGDFFVNFYKTLFLLSGKDMKCIRKITLPGVSMVSYIMITPDLDGDGKKDIIAMGKGASNNLFLAYISSQKGTILKSHYIRLKSGEYLRFTGSFLNDEKTPLLLSDIDGDGFPEVITTTREEFTYQGETYSGSCLVSFSSSTGKEIWRIEGWKIPRKENLMFQFSSKIVYPDLNGDGIDEVIVAWRGEYIKKGDIATYFLIFSGKNGKLLWKRRIGEIKGCLPILYEVIPDMDGDGKKEILMGSTEYDAGEKENTGGIFIISSLLF